MENEHKVISCEKCYHPHRMETALVENHLIRIKGKKDFKIMPPRLKHRRDGRKYISKEIVDGRHVAWSSGEYGTGFVNSPLYVNPNRGENALTKTTIDIFLSQISATEMKGVVGQFNEHPVTEYVQGSTEIHKLYEEECVWRPNQILTWGRMEGGKFVALKTEEAIIGVPINAKQFQVEMKKYLAVEQWNIFANKKSKRAFPEDMSEADILALRLFANIATLQRTEMDNNNCFGLALHQFGMCIETRYLYNLEELYAYLVINRRDPIKERKQQAKLRLNGKIESDTDVTQEAALVEEAVEDTFAYEDED